MQTHALVFDAFEVSRTRVADCLIATFAFDLRDVAWQPGAVAVASARLRPSAGAAAESVLLHADCAGSAYAVPEPQQVRRTVKSRSTVPRAAILERAAGGFFHRRRALRSRPVHAHTARAAHRQPDGASARHGCHTTGSAWVAA